MAHAGAADPARHDSEADGSSAGTDGPIERLSGVGETALYAGLALALAAGGAVLVVDAVVAYVTHLDDGVSVASVELLSALLLVYVFVELLGATRMTLRERRLLAEPFLLVGIIASIKEIVLVAGAERPKDESFEAFRDGMIEVGVLAAVVLVLSISALLLRRREREPEERDREDR